MGKWDKLADKQAVEKTMRALKAHNIESYFVSSGSEARKKVLEILPKGAEIMDMTSVTLDTAGISKEIQESGKYNAVKPKLYGNELEKREKKRLGAAPEWVIGSVHAVTEDGKILIASNTGSQLAAHAYGADNVIWVVGTQKIVKDVDEGMKRVYEHSLLLESDRARKAYGVPGSAVNKLLIVNSEAQPGRITVIFVDEAMGF